MFVYDILEKKKLDLKILILNYRKRKSSFKNLIIN